MASEEKISNLIKPKIMDAPSHLVTSLRVWREVADVMSKDVVSISPNRTVASAAKLMSEDNISCVIVIDNGVLTGILTETDFLRRVVAEQRDFDKTMVTEVMSRPVESASANLSILEASRIMEEKHIKRLPIVSEGRLVGIVTQTDLIRALMSYGMWRDVAEIMSKGVAGIERGATVAEAAKIMASRNISCIAALEGDEAAGVLTQRDLIKRVVGLQKNPAQTRIEEVMSSPVTSVLPHCSIFTAGRIMEKMNIRRLAVMEDKRLCGIITQTDIFLAAKRRLQAEEEKNLRLLEKSQSNIYMLDTDGRITYVNTAFMKLLEVRDPAELLGEVFLPERFWFHPKERIQFSKELNGGRVGTKELTLKTSKGKRVDVTVFSTFTKNIHGRINGSQGIAYDITPKKELVALKETKEKVQQQNEFLKDVLESLTHPFYVIDAKDYTIKLANSALWKGELSENATCYMVSHKRDKPCDEVDCTCPLEEIKRTKEPVTVEHAHYDKDGKARHVEVHGYPIFDSQGNISQIIEYSLDITERKQAEEQLNKTLEELKRFNNLAVGRELRMVELKREVNQLLRELGRQEKYRDTSDITETCTCPDDSEE